MFVAVLHDPPLGCVGTFVWARAGTGTTAAHLIGATYRRRLFADRAALVAHVAVLATRRSFRVAARLTRQNGATVALCLWPFAPLRSHGPFLGRRPMPTNVTLFAGDSGPGTFH